MHGFKLLNRPTGTFWNTSADRYETDLELAEKSFLFNNFKVSRTRYAGSTAGQEALTLLMPHAVAPAGYKIESPAVQTLKPEDDQEAKEIGHVEGGIRTENSEEAMASPEIGKDGSAQPATVGSHEA